MIFNRSPVPAFEKLTLTTGIKKQLTCRSPSTCHIINPRKYRKPFPLGEGWEELLKKGWKVLLENSREG
jgi:hypothetical protein